MANVAAFTNDPRHARLENDVNELLEQNGFFHTAATYHEVMSLDVQNRLREMDDPTSLYIRTRADRIAIHKEHPVAFEYECKTRNPHTRANNLVIEALPLAQHLLKSRLGVRVLYIYRDSPNDIDVGFWADAIPQINKIFIPARSRGLAGYLRTVWPNVELDARDSVRGSGDAFCQIMLEQVKRLNSWQTEIIGELHEYISRP